MDEIQNFIQRNLRRILAGGGLVLSIFAISLLLNTSPKSTFWLMTHSVSVGSKILPGDVATLKANLTSDSTHFEGSGDAVVGQYATRSLQSGDLIAVTDISHTGISTHPAAAGTNRGSVGESSGLVHAYRGIAGNGSHRSIYLYG